VQIKNSLKEKFGGNFIKIVSFFHDNTPSHRACATQKKLAYQGYQCPDHTSYSPDLAPSECHLFPGPKKKLKVRLLRPKFEVTVAADFWLNRKFPEFYEWIS